MYNFFKRFVITLSVFVFGKLHAQAIHQNKDMLYWKEDRKLMFADFQGKPKKEDTALHNVSERMLAHKLGSIIISIDVDYVTVQGKTVFTIRAGMKKDASWIKDKDDTLFLMHEQGHFDICEIYARVLRKDIRNAKTLSQAKAIYDQVIMNEELEHDNYDKENTYQAGGITKNWKEKIRGRLKELEQYENPVVTLLVSK